VWASSRPSARVDLEAEKYRLRDAGGLDDPRDLASRVKEFWREARRRVSLPELPVRRDEPAGAVPPIIAEARYAEKQLSMASRPRIIERPDSGPLRAT